MLNCGYNFLYRCEPNKETLARGPFYLARSARPAIGNPANLLAEVASSVASLMPEINLGA